VIAKVLEEAWALGRWLPDWRRHPQAARTDTAIDAIRPAA